MAKTARPIPVATEFGRRVRQARHAAGWSIEELAERAGLHWTYVGSVERGERNISLVNIVKIAAALGADPAELVAGLRA